MIIQYRNYARFLIEGMNYKNMLELSFKGLNKVRNKICNMQKLKLDVLICFSMFNSFKLAYKTNMHGIS